ncbi:MAG: family 65 glycosyl hydrolase domain-containing protein [Bacteroidota bacterium]
MNKAMFGLDPWLVTQEGWDAGLHEAAESMFSLGNGFFGQRAMHEEAYSGHTLQGSYVAGVYYPDKTRVGWWKNGYPEYFAKVLNATNWLDLDWSVNGRRVDLASWTPESYRRSLNMQRGMLNRDFELRTEDGIRIEVQCERWICKDRPHLACLSYRITAHSPCDLELVSGLNGQVRNKDANYEELFWQRCFEEGGPQGYVQTKTAKLDFEVGVAAEHRWEFPEGRGKGPSSWETSEWVSRQRVSLRLEAGETLGFTKRVAVLSTLHASSKELKDRAYAVLQEVRHQSHEELGMEQAKAWESMWEQADIQIDGDIKAQQGIRFNIFHLHQTYNGLDHRLNIGPKGFTGEKYGGSTYWDTEAYCIPFYLGTAPGRVARQLLEYRYRQLDKAIANASKLGFKDGAALFPMVTMNGEECHNEWEITFEEIHRNGAMVYAIDQYVRYTGDRSYWWQGGLEVMIGIARFWAQRVHWSEVRKAWVMHGVTGPNEYENNVNNNWYTNYLARYCWLYTLKVIEVVRMEQAALWEQTKVKLRWDAAEALDWQQKAEKIALPADDTLGIWLQQDGYLEKEQIMAADLPAEQRPINQHWSWDRILRSCFIKQADVLQGMFVFEDDFSEESLRRNFDFYEPRTVHESSLSPCVHAVLAARLGKMDKAYEMYLRTSRLDLDDYNREVHEGLHITSMAGTWMAVVMGFGGLRMMEDGLSLSPVLPAAWKGYAFRLHWRGADLHFRVQSQGLECRLEGVANCVLRIYGREVTLESGKPLVIQPE